MGDTGRERGWGSTFPHLWLSTTDGSHAHLHYIHPYDNHNYHAIKNLSQRPITSIRTLSELIHVSTYKIYQVLIYSSELHSHRPTHIHTHTHCLSRCSQSALTPTLLIKPSKCLNGTGDDREVFYQEPMDGWVRFDQGLLQQRLDRNYLGILQHLRHPLLF